MKLLLVLCVLGLTVASSETPSSYHDSFGIPEAKRIKASEEDVDGEDSKIPGGTLLPLGKEPYVVGMVITLTTGATSVCGGALLSNTRALTAARCWWDGIRFGAHAVLVLGSTKLFSGGTRVAISSINVVFHENYNTLNLRANIALMRTPWIMYTPYIRSIALPTERFDGRAATVTGYGQTGHNEEISDREILRSINVTVLSYAECQSYYGSDLLPDTVKLCARGGGACAGDAGSPLTAVHGSLPTLIGLVSFWSTSGCHNGFPTGYTRVQPYVSWICSRL